jgi:protein-S-isoprenylcysteine O-methyltransferase Ste14
MDVPMQLSSTQLAALVLTWAAYGAIHSALASLTLKRAVERRWPDAMRAYRLTFNVLAVVLLMPPVWMAFAWGGPLLWRWTGAWAWAANGLALAAVAGFVWTARHYAMDSFSGLAQWRGRDAAVEDGEPLHISPIHRYVRHPWYFFGLVILWTRDMDEARLVSALCITSYLWIGSLLEDRKLVALHGDAYARYRRRVGGLLPLPGRRLSRAEAHALSGRAARGPDEL